LAREKSVAPTGLRNALRSRESPPQIFGYRAKRERCRNGRQFQQRGSRFHGALGGPAFQTFRFDALPLKYSGSGQENPPGAVSRSGLPLQKK
jgi:hypothetical protein